MDHCSKMKNAGAAAALPDDLLLEIFSHVPAKSVCRFKCVSKAWHDLIAEAWHNLIADPDHGKKLRQAMQGLFIMNPGKTGDDSFSFVDLTAGSVPLDVDPGFSFLSPGMRNLVLSDSCNGLILFGYHELPYYDELSDIVCNPTTKQWACVPNCAYPDDRSCYTFLAFDPAVSSHFHLVQFQISEEGSLEALHAYSSETGTWSDNQIEFQEEQGLVAGWHRHVSRLFYYEDTSHAFVNGFLYWVVEELDQRRILVVDVQGKARRMITVPGVPNGGPERFACYIEQSQGCLHCITQEILYARGDNYKLSIWVLQGYETQEWVLKSSVKSQEVFGGLTSDIFEIGNMRIVDIHQDQNLVFLFQCGSGKLIACNTDQKEVSVIATIQKWHPILVFVRFVPCYLEFPALKS